MDAADNNDQLPTSAPDDTDDVVHEADELAIDANPALDIDVALADAIVAATTESSEDGLTHSSGDGVADSQVDPADVMGDGPDADDPDADVVVAEVDVVADGSDSPDENGREPDQFDLEFSGDDTSDEDLDLLEDLEIFDIADGSTAPDDTGEFAKVEIDAPNADENFDDILRDATNAALEDEDDPYRPARERKPAVVPDAAIDTWMRSTDSSDDWLHRASKSTKSNVVFALLLVAGIIAIIIVMISVLA